MGSSIIKNTSWLLLEKLIRMALGLFVGIYVARYLGPKQFGEFSYAVSLYTILFAFSNFGIDGVVVKELIEEKCNAIKENLIFTSMIIKFFLSLLSIMLSLAFSMFNSFDDNSALLLVLSLSLSFLFLNVFDLYFQSAQKNKYVAIANIIMLVITSFCKVILVMYDMEVIYFAGIYILESFLFGLILYLFFNDKKDDEIKFRCSFSFRLTKRILYQSWPLFFSSLSFVLYNSVNTIMLNLDLSSLDVGYYNAASRFVNIWHFLPGILLTSLFPVLISKKNSSNQYEFECFMSKLFSFFIWVPLSIAVLIFFASDLIIDLTYGSEFELASNILSVLIFSNVTIFITSFWNKWMLAEGNTKITFLFQLFKIILLVTFNFFLIPILGLNAILISTILSGVIVQFLVPIFMRTQRRYIKFLVKGLFFKWE